MTTFTARGATKHLALVALYAFLSLIATYPLVLHFTTHVPGDITDAPALARNLWWIQFAIFDLNSSPLYSNYVFYPIGVNLFAYTHTLVSGLLTIPMVWNSSYVTANNCLVVFELTLSAYGMYLLAYDRLRHARRDTQAALFAGFLYGLGSYHLNYVALGQPNMAGNQWVPFYFLYLIRALESRQLVRYTIMAGIFFALSVWTELTYAAFIGLLTLGYWILNAPAISGRTFLKHALTLGMFALAALGPILLDMIRETARYGDYWTVGLALTRLFSADLFGFVLPSSFSPLLGWLTRSLPFQSINWTFVGWVPLALAVIAFVRFREARIWGWLAITFAVLMLGPALQVAGTDTNLPLPFNLFSAVPFFKSNRYPFRLNSILVLALALLASYGLAEVLGHARWRVATLGLVAFAFVEQLAVPMPLTDLRAADIFKTIRADPGDFTVLDLPLSWRNSINIQGAIDYRAHFWQTVHQKRLLDGSTSRNPAFKFQYFLQAPIINSIIALENGRELDDTRRAQDRAMAREVLRFFDIRYVNAFRAKTDPKVLAFVLDLFPATEIYHDEERTVYRIRAAGSRERGILDPSSEIANLHFDDGWGRAQVAPEGFGYRWAEQGESRLWLPLSRGDYEVKFKLSAAAAAQKISLRVNGEVIQELSAADQWSEYTIRVTARDGLNEFAFSTSTTPLRVTRFDDYSIGDTGMVSPVDISVTASGFDAGRVGEIFVGGRNVIERRRGYTLVALNAKTGVVERSDRFDTFSDLTESRHLAQFVTALPTGTIVAGAAVDDVSKELQQEAIDALRQLGVESDLRFQFRAAHAFIGVKGAQPGQAIERVDARLPANVSVGKNVSSDRVAFALGMVTWEAIK